MSLFNRAPKSDQFEHITHEMYLKNLELSERNTTLTLLRHIDEVVLNPAVDAVSTAQAIANELVKQQAFNLALIYTLEQQSNVATLRGSALANPPAAEVEELLKSKLKAMNVQTPNANAFSHVADKMQIHIASSFKPFNSQITDIDDNQLKSTLGIGCMFICPLQASGRLNGMMVLGLGATEEKMTDYQKNLAERLTGTVSIAIENRLLYLELQSATSRLTEQNNKLKALDEAKDEFISMASHQLRTPLTSIKGYLSMVLEGDVGPIRDIERSMLQKAFDSSQKMVYLISDLLNVSRIQSGKFVIENKPINLITLVEGEITQLTNVALGRKIHLSFNKPPKEFPTLLIDDTKIRQVVMNFLDNAIYYTPPGGQVTVNLALTDTEAQFTVIDTGVGVPASVQKNLFSKFYRADNARKMRPDGTGIGLYMAKKVITAQGGALIFKSIEGKGSTFGFSFPLKTMAAPANPAPVPLPNQNTVTQPASQAPTSLHVRGTAVLTAQPKEPIKTP